VIRSCQHQNSLLPAQKLRDRRFMAYQEVDTNLKQEEYVYLPPSLTVTQIEFKAKKKFRGPKQHGLSDSTWLIKNTSQKAWLTLNKLIT